MSTFFQFTLLGLGAGAMYAILGQGLVAIYRGSGVLNFAQGAMAMMGGFLYYKQRHDHDWSFIAAFSYSVVIIALVAIGTHLLLMWRLRDGPPLVKVIVTLGVLTVVQGVAFIWYGSRPAFVTQFLPSEPVDIGSVTVGRDRLYLFGIAVIMTAVLWLGYRYTTIGLATRATAENQDSIAALGWSPGVIGACNWALGGALAAVAGILLTPLSGLQVGQTSLLVIPALAAALVGGFASFPLTLAGGLLIGISQSLLGHYDILGYHVVGLSDTFSLFVILVVLVFRGQVLPTRAQVSDLLPRVGRGPVRPSVLLFCLAAGAFIITISTTGFRTAIGFQLLTALFVLSLIVVTGYAGQLSLAQVALGGVGAFATAKLVEAHGWPFEFAVVGGLAVSLVVGILFGLPALRARGVQLAVVTLSLGLALQQMVFTNPDLGGTSTAGVEVGQQKLFGMSINQVEHPDRYAMVLLVMFIVVACLVSTIRGSRVGRRLLAMRANERAAASVGISTVGAKLYAFSLASMIAGLAGIMLAFQNPTIYFTSLFDPFLSIIMVSYAVLGGIGYLSGATVGASLAAGSIGAYVGTKLFGLEFSKWLAPIGGAALILTVLIAPDGVGGQLAGPARKLWDKLHKPKSSAQDLMDVKVETTKVQPATLEVKDLSVRFGGTRAVDGVTFTVNPGEVVGIIGPNGAGKTTIIDAITGYVKPERGTIALNDTSIVGWPAYRRARAGISRSFQGLELFEDLTVADNLRAASDSRDSLAYVTTLFYGGNSPFPPVVVSAINEFNLAEDLDRLPTELPYGTRRLVAVARALAGGPSILLLDEPAAGLRDAERLELRQVVRRLADTWGLGIMLIEHDVDFVMGVCDRVVALDFGQVIASGTPSEVRASPEVIAAYLGEPPPEEVDPTVPSMVGSSTEPTEDGEQ